MTEQCINLNCEAETGLDKYFYKLPVDVDTICDNAGRLCAIESVPDSVGVPLENEDSLLELVDVQKEKPLKRHMKAAAYQAYRRKNETSDLRTRKLKKNRLRVRAKRQQETDEQRMIRRQKCAERASRTRANETEERRQQRLAVGRLRAAERRKNMSPVERELWRLKNRIQTRRRRQKENEIKKILRRHDNAIRAYLKRSHATKEERMDRRIKDALRVAERRQMETTEERKERLKKCRERMRLRRLEIRTAVSPGTTRKNCSKYSHRTQKMLSILKSIQDHLNYHEIETEHITSENMNSLMIYVKSCHPDLEGGYVETAVHTFLSSSSRGSDSSGTSFLNDDASLLSTSDCSLTGSIFLEGEASCYENLEGINEEIEIKEEPPEDIVFLNNWNY